MKVNNDTKLIRQIADRASDLYKRVSDVEIKPEYIVNELLVVHDNICRLRLQELLDADDGNFAHDIGGIHRHLDIETMSLKDCFSPRFAERGE